MIHAIILGVVLGLAVFAGNEPPPRPYSCRLLDDAQRKCAFGACDQREMERLRKECGTVGGLDGLSACSGCSSLLIAVARNQACATESCTMSHCYVCGRAISDQAVAVLIVESQGSARLHSDCCCVPGLVRYRQTVIWEATLENISAFKTLHRRLVDLNGSAAGSVPILLT